MSPKGTDILAKGNAPGRKRGRTSEVGSQRSEISCKTCLQKGKMYRPLSRAVQFAEGELKKRGAVLNASDSSNHLQSAVPALTRLWRVACTQLL
jgi:hypothetical protein